MKNLHSDNNKAHGNYTIHKQTDNHLNRQKEKAAETNMNNGDIERNNTAHTHDSDTECRGYSKRRSDSANLTTRTSPRNVTFSQDSFRPKKDSITVKILTMENGPATTENNHLRTVLTALESTYWSQICFENRTNHIENSQSHRNKNTAYVMRGVFFLINRNQPRTIIDYKDAFALLQLFLIAIQRQ